MFGFIVGPARLDGYGCVVWLQDGELITCEMNDFDRAGGIDEAWSVDTPGLVTAPTTQEFLDAVNSSLGTTFKMDDFAGR